MAMNAPTRQAPLRIGEPLRAVFSSPCMAPETPGGKRGSLRGAFGTVIAFFCLVGSYGARAVVLLGSRTLHSLIGRPEIIVMPCLGALYD